MNRYSVRCFGLGLLMVVGVTAPARGQCMKVDDPAGKFDSVGAVFIGTVRKTEPTGAHGYHIVMHRAWFDVEHVWKGRIRTTEIVGTVEQFEPGRRYIVFAFESGDSTKRTLRTSLECEWAEEFDNGSGRTSSWLASQPGSAPEPNQR